MPSVGRGASRRGRGGRSPSRAAAAARLALGSLHLRPPFHLHRAPHTLPRALLPSCHPNLVRVPATFCRRGENGPCNRGGGPCPGATGATRGGGPRAGGTPSSGRGGGSGGRPTACACGARSVAQEEDKGQRLCARVARGRGVFEGETDQVLEGAHPGLAEARGEDGEEEGRRRRGQSTSLTGARRSRASGRGCEGFAARWEWRERAGGEARGRQEAVRTLSAARGEQRGSEEAASGRRPRRASQRRARLRLDPAPPSLALRPTSLLQSSSWFSLDTPMSSTTPLNFAPCALAVLPPLVSSPPPPPPRSQPPPPPPLDLH